MARAWIILVTVIAHGQVLLIGEFIVYLQDRSQLRERGQFANWLGLGHSVRLPVSGRDQNMKFSKAIDDKERSAYRLSFCTIRRRFDIPMSKQMH